MALSFIIVICLRLSAYAQLITSDGLLL